MNILKFILVDDAGVGKSCIISQYYSKSFELNHILTTVVDKQIKEIIIKDKKITLEIWDITGQEKILISK